MITARKNALLNRLIYTFLIKSPLRASFHRVYFRQATSPSESGMPVILFGNHSAWWDAHLPMALNEERWRIDGYVMVEDTQLSRYQFFRACGAFSVNRRDGRSAMESLNYAVKILTEAPRRLLLIFPQGEILANDVRPLKFFGGAGRIIKRVVAQAGACALYPLALRYEFIGEQKPDGFISVGQPILVTADQSEDSKAVTTHMEGALTNELDRLRDDVIAYRFSTFTPFIEGAWSINRMWDAVRGRRQIKQVGGD